KEERSSTLSVRVSGFSYDWITLKGHPDLFSPETIPETLPPLSSYTEASVMESKIDTIGFCGSEPLVQYNDGIIRSTVPLPPATAKIAPHDPNLNLARRVLSSALHGDTQSVFQAAAPQANREAIAGMVTHLSGLAKEMGHCQEEAEAIEVHKIL